MRGNKQSQQLARQLFRLSMAERQLSPERVTGVLQYLDKHPPARPLPVLQAYHRLISLEVARSRAVVEHAGPIADSLLQSIESAMSKRYGRPVTTVTKPNPDLLAGVRVRVGDDVYESSVAGQLASLSV